MIDESPITITKRGVRIQHCVIIGDIRYPMTMIGPVDAETVIEVNCCTLIGEIPPWWQIRAWAHIIRLISLRRRRSA